MSKGSQKDYAKPVVENIDNFESVEKEKFMKKEINTKNEINEIFKKLYVNEQQLKKIDVERNQVTLTDEKYYRLRGVYLKEKVEIIQELDDCLKSMNVEKDGIESMVRLLKMTNDSSEKMLLDEFNKVAEQARSKSWIQIISNSLKAKKESITSIAVDVIIQTIKEIIK